MTDEGRGRSKELPKRAKVFWTGRSQAVRLPKEFRFDDEEVEIRREGERVILEPIHAPRRWPRGYWDRLRELAEAAEFPDVEPLPAGRDREDLGEL